MIDQQAGWGQTFDANRPDHMEASGERPWPATLPVPPIALQGVL